MIQQNISLQAKNTLGLPCEAEFFAEITSELDLFEAFQFVKEKNLTVKILGLGSNLVLPPKISGLVLVIKYQKYQIQNDEVTLGAGNLLGPIIFQLAKDGFNLSALTGYPSTIGGSVRGNAGLLGVHTGDFLKTAKLFNFQTGEWILWEQQDFKFSYRHSELKRQKNLLFWEGVFVFNKPESNAVESGEAVEDKVKNVLKERSAKQPIGKSAGSFFKNPLDDPNNPEKKSAGFFIDQCGLKGAKIGGAFISEKHANFFMNDGTATQQDFLNLIELAQKSVWEKFGVKLELEVQPL